MGYCRLQNFNAIPTVYSYPLTAQKITLRNQMCVFLGSEAIATHGPGDLGMNITRSILGPRGSFDFCWTEDREGYGFRFSNRKIGQNLTILDFLGRSEGSRGCLW